MLFYNQSKKPLNVFIMKREDSRTYIVDRLDKLIKNISHKYKVILSNITHYKGVKFDQCAVIEHDDGMFKVIDWSDRDNPSKMESADIINDPCCQYVLKCQYNPKYRVPKLRPFSYFEKTKPKEFSDNLNYFRQIKKDKEEIYWKGNIHLGRMEIIKKIEGLINKDHKDKLPLNDYYKELASHRWALSLPGLGKSCHREYECFGIGTVVVSPRIESLNWMPLVPDFHYVCIDDWNKITNKLTNWDEIRKNAMEYYDNYIRYESSVMWLEHLLEL